MSTKGEFTMMASGTRLQAGSGLLPGLPGNLLLGNVKSVEVLGFIFFSSFFSHYIFTSNVRWQREKDGVCGNLKRHCVKSKSICKICHSLRFLQAGSTSCSKGRYDDPKSPELLVTHPPEVFFNDRLLKWSKCECRGFEEVKQDLPPLEVARFSDLWSCPWQSK